MFYSNYGYLVSFELVSEIFNVEKYHNLEIPVKGQSKSLKVVGSFRVNSTNASSMTTSEFDEIFRK